MKENLILHLLNFAASRCSVSRLLPSMTLAQISAPTPNWGQPPSTVTRWFVFITLVSIHSTSIGRMVRRLITWQTDRKQLRRAQVVCGRCEGVFLPLPRTRFPPWQEQQRRPGSDQLTESEKPWWRDFLKHANEEKKKETQHKTGLHHPTDGANLQRGGAT